MGLCQSSQKVALNGKANLHLVLETSVFEYNHVNINWRTNDWIDRCICFGQQIAYCNC